MTDKKITAAIYSTARSRLVKAHPDEYKALVTEVAAEHGVTLRARRTAEQKAADEADRRAAIARRSAARAEAKAAKAEAARLAKIEKAKARLAALEGDVA